MSINIRIITPSQIICSTTVDEIILPGLNGQLGVLSGHVSTAAALDIGVLRLKLNEKWTPFILFGGFVEIRNDKVTVLINEIEEAAAIKLRDTARDLEIATTNLETAKSEDKLEALRNLKIATARVRAAAFLS
jgi:F-type H+-transporting ATPase subunit epsilon